MELREDQNVLIKKLLESVNVSSSELQSTVPENIAQFLTAALSQVIQSTQDESEESDPTTTSHSDVQRQYLTPADNVESIVEVSGYTIDQRPIGVKFPAEVRRRIISMRKEGLKCKDIAKDLGASVSGVQKVWERFLATGTIRDRKPSTYAGRPRKYSTEKPDEDTLTVAPTLCVPEGSYIETVSPQAVLIDTREPMEVPGATVEVVASTTTHPKELEPSLIKKKTHKHPYRQELLMRLVDNCPLATLKNDVAMATSPHVQNLSESIQKPLYMEYVLGHPFGKAPSPRPFEADLDECKVILTDPVNPLGKEVIAALGYSTKVYFNACCKPSALFYQDHRFLPYSVGPAHIANNMKEVLQVLINLCLDPMHGLSLIRKGPGPVLQAQTSSGETLMSSFTPPNKLSEYWTQLYAYAKLFQCCENFLSPGPPSCPCLLCHPFESFAGTLAISEPSPPRSPPPTILVDTATQLLQLQPDHTPDTPSNVMETAEHIIVSHDEIIKGEGNEEVCVTETTCITDGSPQLHLDSVAADTVTQPASNTQDTDGIQFVAYSGVEEGQTHLRRSTRKRQHSCTATYEAPHTKK